MNSVPTTAPTGAPATQTAPRKKSPSPFQLRLRRFRRLKRGYYSFLILVGVYLLSFLLPFLMNSRAIVVRYDGHYYFPAFKTYFYDTFGFGRENIYLGEFFGQVASDGQPLQGEANYRELKTKFAEEASGNFVMLPPIPYHPNE